MENQKPKKIHYQIVIGVFVLALALGYATGKESREADQQFLQDIFSPYSFLKDIPTFLLFLFIFFNNAFKALLTIILGAVLGIYPIYFIFVNGELIGLVSALTVKRIGVAGTLAGLLPHGILELTAIFISASYGVWIGMKTLEAIRDKVSIRPAIASAFRTYLRIVVPMLLVAALIEAYITPILINLFANNR